MTTITTIYTKNRTDPIEVVGRAFSCCWSTSCVMVSGSMWEARDLFRPPSGALGGGALGVGGGVVGINPRAIAMR